MEIVRDDLLPTPIPLVVSVYSIKSRRLLKSWTVRESHRILPSLYRRGYVIERLELNPYWINEVVKEYKTGFDAGYWIVALKDARVLVSTIKPESREGAPFKIKRLKRKSDGTNKRSRKVHGVTS